MSRAHTTSAAICLLPETVRNAWYNVKLYGYSDIDFAGNLAQVEIVLLVS